MDIRLYKQRARDIRHKTAMPFYPASPAAPAQACNDKAAPWPLAPVPPPGVVTVQVMAAGNGMYCGGDADVDRRAALFISRVQERLRRERMHEQ
ncbi:hypothetical protein BRADI_5g07996v3 [Brachypodium distachyon]|uniref:Uncharacterized protein n=1 Tax=Brachypodium distachyon TaxID=15368 RepID=A0A0Q3KQL1_BRADI|nr:hypothetical protein BRADI_5g07996v3 [Brachypodium distachyon]